MCLSARVYVCDLSLCQGQKSVRVYSGITPGITKCFGLGLGYSQVVEHLFSVLEGLDVISNIERERSERGGGGGVGGV